MPGRISRSISACSATTVPLAKEHDDLDAGVCTHHLYRALSTVMDLARRSGEQEEGHLRVNSLCDWLRKAVAGFARVEGKPQRPVPRLFGGSADQDVFFAEPLGRPRTLSTPNLWSATRTRAQGWDGPPNDHWLLKTLDRADALAKLQDLLQSATPQLAVHPRAAAVDCGSIWPIARCLSPERRRGPIQAIEEDPPPAFAFDLSLADADVKARSGRPYTARYRARRRTTATRLQRAGFHRHVVLRCTRSRCGGRRGGPLRFIRIARFLGELASTHLALRCCC